MVSDIAGMEWKSDRDLADRILGGSLEDLDLLYESYFKRVYCFALKRLGDPGEAEDVAQDVFMTVLSALPSYQGQSSLLVWIFGITRNTVNRRFRGIRPRLEPLEEGGALDIAGREVPADRSVEARRLLNRCQVVIDSELTPLQQNIFVLKHLRSQSIRTIAGLLGKSENAVKASLYRIRRALCDKTQGLEYLLHR